MIEPPDGLLASTTLDGVARRLSTPHPAGHLDFVARIEVPGSFALVDRRRSA